MYTDFDVEGIDVRRVASDWHSGQWSALYSFASTGHIGSYLASEVESCLSKFDANPGLYATEDSESEEDMRSELQALLDYVTQPILSVWSSYGHEFLDSDGYGSCLRCGAEYELVHDDGSDPSHGAYQASDGSEPMACTRDTSMIHGDPRETGHSLDCETGCAHCQHECNCVLCSG